MKIPRFKIVLALCASCLAVVLVFLVWDRDPFARLERMAECAARLEAAYPRPYRLPDYLVGLLHRVEPMRYYEDEVAKAQKALLASGDLVERRIAIPSARSDREIYTALYEVRQRTGAYYWAYVQSTNHLVLLVSRPRDIAAFSAVLR